MKILTAHSDRDLLNCFTALLEKKGYSSVTAFDGTQVVRKIYTERPDIVLLEPELPLADVKKIIAVLDEERIPFVALTKTPKRFVKGLAAYGFLVFPFCPSELYAAIDAIAAAIGSENAPVVDGTRVDMNSFLYRGKRLTVDELDLLSSITEGKERAFDVSETVESLNEKLESVKCRSRVKYILNEGYRLVNDNE